ncbi:defensin D2-like [Pyrus ussuriensis x Pyrus communis]|uniref:Defensin D2-like n=1 Tax=Pyrus ussuriensis x Pyrus communis TaxID=2448454 RepID=A0A5N5H5Y0_9ROSA|nr:defensin D2-like [Pyrus ussuriensis x Pyrus communis]
MERNLFGLVLFFIILLTSQEMVMHSEARICEEPSKTFRGLCFKDANCIVRCRSEGHGYGKCSHILRQCRCLKACAAAETDQSLP